MLEELKEAIGEFDVAHIFLLLTTVCGSAVSVYMSICRRFGKYSAVLKKIGSCVSLEKNKPAKTPEPPPQALATAPPLTEPTAEPPAKPPPCTTHSCNRTSYTLVREKLGKVHCTQYSIKRWEYPLQIDAERSCKNGTKTNSTHQ